jgi:FKBP-type peptidyl-prolyl cis-trans isomerase
MKRNLIENLKKILATTILIMIAFGCNQKQKEVSFKSTDSGLKYKFYVENDDSTKVNLNDVVTVYMNYRTQDSVLFKGGKNKIPFQVIPKFDGDLMEGILMMHNGDSATFAMDTKIFFVDMMGYPEVPVEFSGKNELFFDVKVIDVKPENEMQKASRLKMEERKNNEQLEINKFLSENQITVTPTASGLYYIVVTEGTGAQAVPGKKVKVHYTGKFLNGEKFDSSYDRNKPIEFQLGTGSVIQGWDEAIAMMKEGGKASLIIPSKIGYGDQDRGPIKAYTPLTFDVELVEVEK